MLFQALDRPYAHFDTGVWATAASVPSPSLDGLPVGYTSQGTASCFNGYFQFAYTFELC